MYDAARDPYSPDRLQRVGELRRALEAGELVLHYQPKVSVASRAVTGVEALVRWQHPQRGLLGPGEFGPLSERTGMFAARRAIDVLGRLRALGVRLSLDDFGTGSSSFAFLRELPVQELKIDKSFVFGIEDDPGAAIIARTIVELAHNLGLRAVAEGIETEESYRLLAECGCDYGQGFLMGRPMPASELTELASTPA